MSSHTSHFDELTPVDGAIAAHTPARIALALRSHAHTTDRAFDRFLPPELREASSHHWSPVAVAAAAARWIDEFGIRRVLDVGSGVGKFCVVAALSGSAEYIGVEHRPRLVAVATRLARLFGVDDRARFQQGDLKTAAQYAPDAFYFYNPFGENLYGREDHLDAEVEINPERFRRDVAATASLLAAARPGTWLITYNGFGGRVPAGYETVRLNKDFSDTLTLLRRT